VTASDVVLSEKIKFALVAVPALWLTYAVIALVATPLHLQDVLTLLMVAPGASYIGVISAESGMIDLRDLYPRRASNPGGAFPGVASPLLARTSHVRVPVGRRPMLARLFYDARAVESLKGEQRDLQEVPMQGLEPGLSICCLRSSLSPFPCAD